MNKLEQELQKIDEFMKTPVHERPRYKAFYNKVKEMAEQEQETEYEPKWMRESYVWMANRKTLQMIQEQESEWYLNQAKYMTRFAFQLYNNEQ